MGPADSGDRVMVCRAGASLGTAGSLQHLWPPPTGAGLPSLVVTTKMSLYVRCRPAEGVRGRGNCFWVRITDLNKEMFIFLM